MVSRLECKADPCCSGTALITDGFNSIDTGIDYKHPSLGGGFGQGFLVAGGYDFVGDAFTGKKKMFSYLFRHSQRVISGSNNPVPDPDPYDNCAGKCCPHIGHIISF